MEVATRNLAELESVIERGLTTFMDVGTALMEIRDERLYRETYSDFDAYCRERWGFSRVRSTQIITAARIANELVTTVTTPLPIRESQVRELARAQPEQRAEIWQAVVEEHGPEPTATEVRKTVERRYPSASSVVRSAARSQLDYPVNPPQSNITALPNWVERLPEETIEAINVETYLVQLPEMVDIAVIAACQTMWTAARAATAALHKISWDYVTDEMRNSETVTKYLGYLDSDMCKFTEALQNVRRQPAQLRRVK